MRGPESKHIELIYLGGGENEKPGRPEIADRGTLPVHSARKSTQRPKKRELERPHCSFRSPNNHQVDGNYIQIIRRSSARPFEPWVPPSNTIFCSLEQYVEGIPQRVNNSNTYTSRTALRVIHN